jgi:hypothetical protein
MLQIVKSRHRPRHAGARDCSRGGRLRAVNVRKGVTYVVLANILGRLAVSDSGETIHRVSNTKSVRSDGTTYTRMGQTTVSSDGLTFTQMGSL